MRAFDPSILSPPATYVRVAVLDHAYIDAWIDPARCGGDLHLHLHVRPAYAHTLESKKTMDK
jgi:hypothetical protein